MSLLFEDDLDIAIAYAGTISQPPASLLRGIAQLSNPPASGIIAVVGKLVVSSHNTGFVGQVNTGFSWGRFDPALGAGTPFTVAPLDQRDATVSRCTLNGNLEGIGTGPAPVSGRLDCKMDQMKTVDMMDHPFIIAPGQRFIVRGLYEPGSAAMSIFWYELPESP